MKPGDVKKFAIDKGNHICKVEIMEYRKLTGAPPYYICRRIDNGTMILAWEENLA